MIPSASDREICQLLPAGPATPVAAGLVHPRLWVAITSNDRSQLDVYATIQPPPPDRRGATWPRLVVTDLDGTLLDDSYGFEPARPALTELGRAGITLVLASSKTRAEMVPLAANLGLGSPLIVENGGAILVPAPEGYRKVAADVSHAALRRALAEIERETGARVRSFSSCSLDEVAALTGLDRESARLARDREHDEPFVLEDPARAVDLQTAAARRGLRVTRGGRFFHLTGDFDKGTALRQLHAVVGEPRPILGLGDAPNDLPMLETVDRPIVVPRGDGAPDPALARALPGAELAPAPGPAGWDAAVRAVLAGGTLSRVSKSSAR